MCRLLKNTCRMRLVAVVLIFASSGYCSNRTFGTSSKHQLKKFLLTVSSTTPKSFQHGSLLSRSQVESPVARFDLTAEPTIFNNAIRFLARPHLLFYQRTLVIKSDGSLSVFLVRNSSAIPEDAAIRPKTSGLKTLAEDVREFSMEGSHYIKPEIILRSKHTNDVAVEVTVISSKNIVC